MIRKIIYSHGFGVDATDRGLFSDIAKALPQYAHVMFDFNLIDAEGNMTAKPLDQQVILLNSQIHENKTDQLTLVCHSQGCLTAALADLIHVRQLIFLAPPDNFDLDRFMQIFGKRPGAHFDLNGMSSIPRRDGTTTYIGKDYLDSVHGHDIRTLFSDAASKVEMVIIRAADDEIVGLTDFGKNSATIITLPGNHDFRFEARTELIGKLHEILG